MAMDQVAVDASDAGENRRTEKRFAIGRGRARVKCRPFEVDGAVANVVPSGLRGLWFRLRAQTCGVINLSKGGVAIESSVALARGQRVTVHLELPDSLEPLSLHGTVRWTSRARSSRFHSLGIQFDPFGRDERNPTSALEVLRGLEARYAD